MFEKTSLYAYAEKVKQLASRENVTFRLVLDNIEVKNLIINLNTEEQMNKQSVNADGEELTSVGGTYSPVTMIISKAKGRPKKSLFQVNLKDTGRFYKSFRVRVGMDSILITADTIKSGEDLESRWGKLVGLTDEHLQELIQLARELYIKYYRKHLFLY
jgi:hypothetical protein